MEYPPGIFQSIHMKKIRLHPGPYQNIRWNLFDAATGTVALKHEMEVAEKTRTKLPVKDPVFQRGTSGKRPPLAIDQLIAYGRANVHFNPAQLLRFHCDCAMFIRGERFLRAIEVKAAAQRHRCWSERCCGGIERRGHCSRPAVLYREEAASDAIAAPGIVIHQPADRVNSVRQRGCIDIEDAHGAIGVG